MTTGGRVEAAQAVELRTRVGGYLEKISFKEGQWSSRRRAVQIDPRPYQEQAEAECCGRADETVADLERVRMLMTKAAIARGGPGRGRRTEAQATLVATRAAMNLVG